MFILDLFENPVKHASFCFGRMNPPTLGHKELLKTVANNSQGGDYFIFATKTHKLPDNPLDYDTKFKFLQAMFPEYADHMVYDPALKTIMQVAQWLYDKGYNTVTFCAGSDRLPEFQKLLDTYNGKGQPGDKGYYIFSKINYVSSGERDADAEGLAGISASKARVAAKEGNFEDFVEKTGAGKLAKPLYDAVRAAMGVSEDIAPDASSTASPIPGRIKETAGVGVVATNKKMARDPRYSTSITKDVKPSTPKRMLRALRLAEDNLEEAWSQKQRRGVDCNNPKGFSQKAHCAGRKARQAGRKTKSKPISEAKQLEFSTVPMIKKFLPLVKKELKLDKLPKIKIRNHVTVHDGQATFGRFVNDEQTIYLGIADRHPVDVLRTLAHELVHYKQFLDGRIDHKSGETGSPIENEAHAVAGVIMRHFNKKYPNAIKLDDIELMENQKKNLKIENTDFVSGHISYNNTLNPIAWDNSTLKPEIRNRLLKIAKIFVEYLEVPNFKIDDIVLTGSMANFNWTKYSDFDLHIVTDYNNLQCDDIAEVFYRAKKELWNNKHNITIGGHEVELYVEDSANPPVSAGIYSLLNDTWIQKPSYNKPELDNTAINKKVEDLVKQIKQAIASHDVDDIARLKDKLRRMRRSGLDRGGEFSVENLSYKILRNLGLLEKLSDVQKNKLDSELSIKEEQTSGKKLVIFDIDDTLVHTQTQVKVIKDGKVVKSLNSHEFTHYKLQPGEEFDFGAFRDAKEFFLNSKPIIPMINQLKYDIRTGNKVVMVTARADFNDKELFLDTFRKFGIDMSKVHVYRAGNITDKIPTEEKKKLIIRKLLNSDQYDKAIMYDDALPNLESFVSLKNEYSNTKFYAWHVSLEGEASEYRRTNETVLEDQDSNLKSVALAKQNIKAILNAAQNVYDKWDESEIDTYAGGGICHIIADAICDVMGSIGVDATPVSCSYEQHVYVAAKFAEGVYTIDIPYHIYETGGGFSWKKLPDVEFDQRDIVFYRVSSDPEEFDNFTALEEGELIPWPKGTVKVDVSDVYDWYKIGQHISNLKGLGKHDFGKGPPQTVMAFGSEPIEHEYLKNLNKIGLKTYDIDEGVAEESEETLTERRRKKKRRTMKKRGIYGPVPYYGVYFGTGEGDGGGEA